VALLNKCRRLNALSISVLVKEGDKLGLSINSNQPKRAVLAKVWRFSVRDHPTLCRRTCTRVPVRSSCQSTTFAAILTLYHSLCLSDLLQIYTRMGLPHEHLPKPKVRCVQ
jgi:hypothetical protein